MADLDVLLRHRLLLKPGGFEGFGFLRKWVVCGKTTTSEPASVKACTSTSDFSNVVKNSFQGPSYSLQPR